MGVMRFLPAVATVVAATLPFCDAAIAGEWFKSRHNGLTKKAEWELRRANLDQYLGAFAPSSSEPFASDWIRHDFDSEGGDGPICISGSDYSVFTKAGDPEKLIIFLQGGGACWEGAANCFTNVDDQVPPPADELPGFFAQSSPDGTIDNDLGDWSVVYMPYCDGSVFGGDNAIADDPDFGIRHHRGLRNLSAGMDVAQSVFGEPDKVLIAGSSAGGVGSAVFAPFLARFIYGNDVGLYVYNDAGPVALDPSLVRAAARARRDDWQFDQFYPRSCVRQGLCDPLGDASGIIRWRLDNDRTIQESFYSTDGDETNIFFVSLNIPGIIPIRFVDQARYRGILDTVHQPIRDAHPERYKRYIVSGGNPLCDGFIAYAHTAAQGGAVDEERCPDTDRFYDLTAEGVPLWAWANGFVQSDIDPKPWKRPWFWRDRGFFYGGFGQVGVPWWALFDEDGDDETEAWTDVVEPFVTAPSRFEPPASAQ
ncbi:MAG: pectin acetylesterase-family hydrolase [Pseudomonadota bacterium]